VPMPTRVVPFSGDTLPSGEIPIASLNPDTDGDGQVEPWETECYEKIKAADADGSGNISVKELFEVIKRASDEVKEAQKGGIPISTLDPDTDGDGKVEKWEVDVFERIKAADEDKSGSINVKELFGVIKGAAESDKQKKLYRKAAMALAAVVLFLIGALVAVSLVGAIVGGNMIKESKVPDCSATPEAEGCEAGKLVSVGTVESFTPSVFSLARAPTEQLTYLKSVTMYIDMSASAKPAAIVQATFKVSGAYKSSDTLAFLVTESGYTIELDAASESGSIEMNSATYPVMDELPASAGRSLNINDQPMLETMTARHLAEHHQARRRELNMFAGALLTSGSFTMMASSAFRRRELQENHELQEDHEQQEDLEQHGRELNMFAGALLTSGSFTMMASSAF